jgi:pantothenate kinase
MLLTTLEGLAAQIRHKAPSSGRLLVAIAGPPGAGKSTAAAELVSRIGSGAQAVPMDGFHYDDAVLIARGLRQVKGAPETFDVAGFLHLLRRLRDEDEIAIPLFDRDLELSRGAAGILTVEDRILVIEGNYLLLRETPWDQVSGQVDLTVWLDVPETELDRRLVDRWAHFGKSPEAARAWIDNNDMPNIRRVTQGSAPADYVIRWG